MRPGVAHHASLASSQREVHDGGLPGHPSGKRTDRVGGLIRVKPDAAFRGPACIVVLDPVPVEDRRTVSVIHLDGDGELVFPLRPEQEFRGGRRRG